MAETTETAVETAEPEVVEPDAPEIAGVQVAVPFSGPHVRTIVHDFGRSWDLNDDGSLTVWDAQERGIAAYAPHNWEHVSLVFQGDD